ncbi:ANTAR domain-containing response regulator [uncultured Pseudoramibacter sp.]|uniref:ANTAR domain-containing response regulator n=1 Tax=uncultured Pseudoramibacter sp. TaxID=1623493 RepID=UPI0025F2223F|nr:ANTAR domain-containing protein [uncultured Pseudoramibacter sp.]
MRITQASLNNQRVYRVLLISSAERFNTALQALLPERRYSPVTIVTNAAAGRRALNDQPYDFVIINTPLPDEFGSELAIHLSQNRAVVPLLFVGRDHMDDIHNQVAEYGVLTLPKPATGENVRLGLRWMAVYRERLRRLEKKSVSLEDKMKEIRLVNKAKWLLIDQKNMNEMDAHHFIEKQAMNHSVSKGTIAEAILKNLSV